MNVRRATADDGALLLRWRNDPQTRAMSFDPEAIDSDRHRAWLAEKLGDPHAEIWIGEVDDIPIGQVRLDLSEERVAIVSISLDPDARGRGYGLTLLQAVIASQALGATVLRAEIRPENAVSLRMFQRAGFSISQDGADRVVLERPTAAA